MGSNFDKRNYTQRIAALTQRAKKSDRYIRDLDIGESCYLLSLIGLIQSYRMKLVTQDELYHGQKNLETQLEKYYQHSEISDMHIRINNRCSEVMTEAEKHGCPICKKLVRIFDGREK